LLVSEAEIEEGVAELDASLKAAIEQAAANIRTFHEAQRFEVGGD
jgi:histidinol dehydrogenase